MLINVKVLEQRWCSGRLMNAMLSLLLGALAEEISAETFATLQENNNVVERLDRYSCRPSTSNGASSL